MDLSINKWREFKISDLFDVYTGGDLILGDIEDGDIPIASNSIENNNIAATTSIIAGRKLFNHKYSISVADRGKFWAFIQGKDFYIGTRAKALVCKNKNVSSEMLTFIVTIINQESFKFSYGRNCCANLPDILLKMPIQRDTYDNPIIDKNYLYSTKGYIPDWKFMEDYIKSLYYKPITTTVRDGSSIDLNVAKWEEFKVSDIFEVRYGINMELNTCDETTSDDPEGIAFVARTAENNGVSAYVKRIEGKEPQPAETITVAGGGSVLSTFVQRRSFYSGRDLYILIPKVEMNLFVKIFICTVLYSNQYRYSYGRQANKTLPSLVLKLPIQKDDKGRPIIDNERNYSEKGYIPDWEFMERYIKTLPYSDRI